MTTTDNQIEELLWRRFQSEHRRLDRVLDDVGSLIAAGSFETARKRFGEHRLAAERQRFTGIAGGARSTLRPLPRASPRPRDGEGYQTFRSARCASAEGVREMRDRA